VTGINSITLNQGQQRSDVRSVGKLYRSPYHDLSNEGTSFLLEVRKLLARLLAFRGEFAFEYIPVGCQTTRNEYMGKYLLLILDIKAHRKEAHH